MVDAMLVPGGDGLNLTKNCFGFEAGTHSGVRACLVLCLEGSYASAMEHHWRKAFKKDRKEEGDQQEPVALLLSVAATGQL